MKNVCGRDFKNISNASVHISLNNAPVATIPFQNDFFLYKMVKVIRKLVSLQHSLST